MGASQKPKLLCIALESAALAPLQNTIDRFEVDFVPTADAFYAEFEKWQDGMYAQILVGSEDGIDLANEAAQILISQCPCTQSFYVTTKKEALKQKALLKNGIKKLFLLPLDSASLNEHLIERLSSYDDKPVFKSVKSLDIQAGSTLEFSTYIYLPLNKKFVRYSTKDQVLPPEKVEKLGKYNVSSLHVEQKDMNKFYSYAAANLRSVNNGISDTERESKLTESVRQLLLDLFDPSTDGDFDKGKEMIANSQKIVSSFITAGKSTNWYNDLIRAMGGSSGGFSHAAQVSTFAFLFALALKHPRPEDLAMAGFLHDIGMLEVPEDLENRPRETWTPDEIKLWDEHPLRTVNQIKAKKMIISAEVEKAILQHHECQNGKGIPKGLPAAKISIEAQILSLADQFEDLTRLEEGKKRYSPSEAFEEIRKNGSVSSELIAKIIKLFPSKIYSEDGTKVA